MKLSLVFGWYPFVVWYLFLDFFKLFDIILFIRITDTTRNLRIPDGRTIDLYNTMKLVSSMYTISVNISQRQSPYTFYLKSVLSLSALISLEFLQVPAGMVP